MLFEDLRVIPSRIEFMERLWWSLILAIEGRIAFPLPWIWSLPSFWEWVVGVSLWNAEFTHLLSSILDTLRESF